MIVFAPINVSTNEIIFTHIHPTIEAVEKHLALSPVIENQMRVDTVIHELDLIIGSAVAKIVLTTEEEDADIFAAPTVQPAQLKDLENAFNVAMSNGMQKPSYRAFGLTITKAPMTGANPGALYVKKDGEYAGKIVGGKLRLIAPFQHLFNSIMNDLLKIAADPKEVAKDYGKMTGVCCMCGITLTDPVSVANGIGPICAGHWGF